ncbi:digestive cysteine proteinase 1-like [Pecten maximus]|uniref:digestive cysteine proteinase 1-like n=1 Tax=Pecten maximus TaxID=6579 RepID=UPI001458FF52|nr:digestive cysteine proteinase 1-like [Pecten maximus]
MAMGGLGRICVVFITVICICRGDNPPQWPTSYMLTAELELPYAEIKEPFTAYYDGVNNMSRVDFYGGMVKTVQRQDVKPFGVGYKVAPITTYKVTNQMTCFGMNGTSDGPITIQSVLPDLTGFQKVGKSVKLGKEADQWQLVNVVGEKKNTYTIWINSDGSPMLYEMMGYDTLLGSHYDKYYIKYTNFTANAKFDDSTFAYPKGLTCGDFPGPGASERHVLMNPMKEYIHHYDQHVQDLFGQFKIKHGRKYHSIKEHAQRHHHFRNNLRYIHSKNRAGLSFSLAVNHLADKSVEELSMMNGFRRTPGHHGGLPFDKTKYSVKDTPVSWDWRLYGAVTPVKDQAVCGSCWSFGTVGTIEGAYFLKSGHLVRLSQQELMDCSWGEGNNACDGGEDFRSYNWIMKNKGITSEEMYGPYLAQDGKCHAAAVTPVVTLKNYVNVTKGDLQALKFAIAHQGPVSVAIDASHKSLSFYANGIYYEPACGNTDDALDHAVLAVGYGTIAGQDYWLVKNSWSTYWGNDGYVLMSQKNNNCGVATAATYVIL